jgi:integrase/recombinase XerD
MKAYLEPEEVALMEKAATCLRDRLLIRLLYHLGCRISEALALTVEDIDFDNGTIRILHLKARLKLSCESCGARLGKSHAFCPQCGGKVDKAQAEKQEHCRQRVLPIDGDTLKMLKEYIERGGPTLKNGKRLIFGIKRNRAWQIVCDCAKRAGLPKLVNPETGRVHNVGPHKLRDAFAVMAVKTDDSGDGLRLLQEHLGHASFNTTAKYRKVAGEEHRQWYQKLWNKESHDPACQTEARWLPPPLQSRPIYPGLSPGPGATWLTQNRPGGWCLPG